MHTTDEARKLWCPWARVLEGQPPGGAGVNRAGPEAGFYCIASDCMAWRWVPLKVTPEFLAVVKRLASQTKDKPPYAKSIKAVADDPASFNLPTEPFSGFCGLAGKE